LRKGIISEGLNICCVVSCSNKKPGKKFRRVKSAVKLPRLSIKENLFDILFMTSLFLIPIYAGIEKV
jgi:hypothetical protein